MTCGPFLSQGEPCSFSYDFCGAGLTCALTDGGVTCQPPKWVSPGQSCIASVETCTLGACGQFLRPMTCPAIVPDAQSCGTGAQCDYGSYCINGYCQKNDSSLTCTVW